jgi:curved DNA-binding protein CbpA
MGAVPAIADKPKYEGPRCGKRDAKCYYKTLGVKPDASLKEIRKKYRKLSVKYHPDKNKGDPDAKSKFDRIGEAYETIGDQELRSQYDNFGGQDFNNPMQARRAANSGRIKNASFYQDDRLITTMTSRNFKRTQRGMWLVKFYAPWCGHCQESAPDFRRTALLLEGKVNLAAVNCDEHKRLCMMQRIHGYPTLKFFHFKKDIEEIYPEQDHSSDAVTKWIDKLSMNHVVRLDQDNFDAEVMGSKHLWIVDFSAGDWCGPCTQLKSSVRDIAAELNGFAKVGLVNCDEEGQDWCSKKHGISYYPYLKIYPRGPADIKKEGASEIEAGNLHKSFLLSLFAQSIKASLAWRETHDADAFREAVVDFYLEHNSSKMELVDRIIKAYRGDEDKLIKDLHRKYNVPLPKDSPWVNWGEEEE